MLACNRGYPLGKKIPDKYATTKAGGEVWPQYGDEGPTWRISDEWYHYRGPTTVYLADCEGPCEDWVATGKRWFKIWETGYFPTGWPAGSIERSLITDRKTWQQKNLAAEKRACNWYPVRMTTPMDVKPGNYLMRHEVFYSEGDLTLWPQLNPTCANIKVIGNETAFPSDEYLVSFLGAYKTTDPAFANQGPKHAEERAQTYNYTIPCPKVWKS
ncbi:glycoside hydrolase [Aspergillus undulatus]|uniref:glycoside hydrolase n=1 Tax=Aspergillus undulatus TaxID=1810928 RepID=UPI003CCD3AA8